jgi:hypothetical protein
MKNACQVVVTFLLSIAFGGSPAHALPTLWDYGFNVNGAFTSDAYPSGMSSAGFNEGTGLGTLSWTGSAAGSYSILAWFDHEFETVANFTNEYGAAMGTPGNGQRWEIDEPGYVFGDIYDHISDPATYGAFDNTNGVPSFMPDDVSLGLGWEFTLNPGDTATLAIILTQDLLGAITDFYLIQTDADTLERLFFYGRLDITPGGGGGTVPVPEPATIFLVGSGLMGLVRYARAKRKV